VDVSYLDLTSIGIAGTSAGSGPGRRRTGAATHCTIWPAHQKREGPTSQRGLRRNWSLMSDHETRP